MTCPVCGDGKTHVIDCKTLVDYVWRRRECQDCGARFNTIEVDLDMYQKTRKVHHK